MAMMCRLSRGAKIKKARKPLQSLFLGILAVVSPEECISAPRAKMRGIPVEAKAASVHFPLYSRFAEACPFKDECSAPEPGRIVRGM